MKSTLSFLFTLFFVTFFSLNTHAESGATETTNTPENGELVIIQDVQNQENNT